MICTAEYQTLENNLDVRTKKLDRLETMVRNSAASGGLGPQDMLGRMAKLEDAYRQLKVENATLRTAQDVRSRAAQSQSDGTMTYAGGGSPSPSVPRGPEDRDRSRSSRSKKERSSRPAGSSRTNTAPEIARPSSGVAGSMDVALAGDAGYGNNDHRWMFRLRDMEYKLKAEREGRNQDRHDARLRLGNLESENRDLRERARRTNSEAE